MVAKDTPLLLTTNCGCFTEEIFQNKPISFHPNYPNRHLQRERLRVQAFENQIYKHLKPAEVNSQFKLCCGVTKTTARVLRNTYLRHKKTLQLLQVALTALTTSNANKYIFAAKIPSGKIVLVNEYISAVSTLTTGLVKSLEVFQTPTTPAKIESLLTSENCHKLTLSILEGILEKQQQNIGSLFEAKNDTTTSESCYVV